MSDCWRCSAPSNCAAAPAVKSLQLLALWAPSRLPHPTPCLLPRPHAAGRCRRRLPAAGGGLPRRQPGRHAARGADGGAAAGRRRPPASARLHQQRGGVGGRAAARHRAPAAAAGHARSGGGGRAAPVRYVQVVCGGRLWCHGSGPPASALQSALCGLGASANPTRRSSCPTAVHVEACNTAAAALYQSSGFDVEAEESEATARTLNRNRRLLLHRRL